MRAESTAAERTPGGTARDGRAIADESDSATALCSSELFMPTVAEDVAFGPLNQRLPPDEVRARVREVLASVGAEHLADRPPPIGFPAASGTRPRSPPRSPSAPTSSCSTSPRRGSIPRPAAASSAGSPPSSTPGSSPPTISISRSRSARAPSWSAAVACSLMALPTKSSATAPCSRAPTWRCR